MSTGPAIALVLLVAAVPLTCRRSPSAPPSTPRAAGATASSSSTTSATTDAMAKAWRAYRAGDDEIAAASFRRVLALDPRRTEAQYGLALIDERHARFDRAVAELRQASQAAPASSVYLAALGEAYIRAGRLEEAEETLDRLRQLARTHDVVPAQIRILAADLRRAETLAAARRSQ